MRENRQKYVEFIQVKKKNNQHRHRYAERRITKNYKQLDERNFNDPKIIYQHNFFFIILSQFL